MQLCGPVRQKLLIFVHINVIEEFSSSCLNCYQNWFHHILNFIHRCAVKPPDRIVHLLIVTWWCHWLLWSELLCIQPFLSPGTLLICHSQHPFPFATHTTNYVHGSVSSVLQSESIRDIWYSRDSKLKNNYINLLLILNIA